MSVCCERKQTALLCILKNKKCCLKIPNVKKSSLETYQAKFMQVFITLNHAMRNQTHFEQRFPSQVCTLENYDTIEHLEARNDIELQAGTINCII